MITAFVKANSFVQFLTVLGIFIFVLAITYFTTRFVGAYQKNAMIGSNIVVLETQRISSTKYIQIIKVGAKCFVIAIAKDTVTCLGEVDEDTLNFPENTSKEYFKDILENFKAKRSRDDEDA